MCRSCSTTTAKAWCRGARAPCRRSATATSARSQAGCRPGRDAGYELFQDVNSYAKAFGELVESSPPHAVAAGRRRRRADRRRRRYRDSRRPPLRRIRHHEHPGLDQRARRRTGAARRASRARSRHHHRRQLRRPHPLDHRHAVADQCRRAQQGGGAAQRHHRLDTGQAHARTRRRPARRDRRRSRTPKANARDVAYRAGVRRIGMEDLRALRRRPTARSIASTSATPRNTPPATSRVFAITPAASWCRRSTWPHPCAARASC